MRPRALALALLASLLAASKLRSSISLLHDTHRFVRAATTILWAIGIVLSIPPWVRAQSGACDPTQLASSPTGEEDKARGAPPTYSWEGNFQETQVCYSSRQSGAQLAGYLDVPANLDSLAGPLPVVVIGPGSGTGRAYNYLWSSRELASNGYIALVSDPQGSGSSAVMGDPSRCTAGGCPGVPWQQASNYIDNLLSATDFVFAQQYPWLKKADLSHVGLAGHSLSARAASFVQGIDPRIKAVVAWDNMSSTLEGDAGVASGGGACGQIIGGELPGPSQPVTPLVPTMGEASDGAPTCMPTDNGPEVKKTGYSVWRAAGLPTMEVVMKGTTHLDWAQTSGSNSALLELFEFYTRAWFDRYLKNELAAFTALTGRDALGETPAQIFSSKFHSAFFLPEVPLDCPDLLTPACVPAAVLQATPSSGATPLNVTLDASRSSDFYSSDPITAYTFNFGDGSSSVTGAQSTITHTYSQAGAFIATVTATDSNGLTSAPAEQSISVSPGPESRRRHRRGK